MEISEVTRRWRGGHNPRPFATVKNGPRPDRRRNGADDRWALGQPHHAGRGAVAQYYQGIPRGLGVP